MSRFMAPRFFTQEQSNAVEQALRELDIGDEEGVRIFIIALEYELAEYEKSEPTESPRLAVPAAVVPELETLSRDLAEVARQLELLPDNSRQLLLEKLSAQDPFARQHDHVYLDAISNELSRIASVCLEANSEQPVASTLGETEKHFISVVAEAYFECFESSPGKNGGEPFTSLLQRIIEISDLRIALQKNELAPILSSIG